MYVQMRIYLPSSCSDHETYLSLDNGIGGSVGSSVHLADEIAKAGFLIFFKLVIKAEFVLFLIETIIEFFFVIIISLLLLHNYYWNMYLIIIY